VTVAVVTGASRGIGRAVALELARRGVALVLVGRASEEQERSAALAREAGAPDVRCFACDFGDGAATERAASDVAREFPAPDVLVNNAGIAPRVSVEDTTPALWDEAFAVNLRAPFVFTRALLPGMRRARRGRIVHVGSISGTQGTARLAAYCATKWGLTGFMKSLAAELSDSGVTTLAVLPGSTDTRMLEGSGFPARMSAEDVARSIVHFALDAPAAAHNGAVIEMFGA
jgi:3-oxoacyl-[acyl-carrier protein] reductase